MPPKKLTAAQLQALADEEKAAKKKAANKLKNEKAHKKRKENPKQCPLCLENFCSKQALNLHFERFHRGMRLTGETDPNDSSIYLVDKKSFLVGTHWEKKYFDVILMCLPTLNIQGQALDKVGVWSTRAQEENVEEGIWSVQKLKDTLWNLGLHAKRNTKLFIVCKEFELQIVFHLLEAWRFQFLQMETIATAQVSLVQPSQHTKELAVYTVHAKYLESQDANTTTSSYAKGTANSGVPLKNDAPSLFDQKLESLISASARAQGRIEDSMYAALSDGIDKPSKLKAKGWMDLYKHLLYGGKESLEGELDVLSLFWDGMWDEQGVAKKIAWPRIKLVSFFGLDSKEDAIVQEHGKIEPQAIVEQACVGNVEPPQEERPLISIPLNKARPSCMQYSL